MYQIIEQTDEQKKAIYMKCTKEELIERLIEANRILASYPVMVNSYGGRTIIIK